MRTDYSLASSRKLMPPLSANFYKLLLRPPSCCTTLELNRVPRAYAHDSTSTAPKATRGMLQLGRIRHCSSLRNCPGSHRTIRLGSFLRRILHSSRAQGLQAEGLVPGSSAPALVPGSSAPVWAAVESVLAQVKARRTL